MNHFAGRIFFARMLRAYLSFIPEAICVFPWVNPEAGQLQKNVRFPSGFTGTWLHG